jgi:beta-carotene 3-hydroxylase
MIDRTLHAATFLAALAGMEFVAWATHRWLMHGPLWALHRSHHAPRDGRFERNDLFALAFATPAVLLFAYGSQPGHELAWWAALGITSYGLLYALVHDGWIHRRWPMPRATRSRYLRRLVQAHRLHHAVRERDGAVSFGFLLPGDVRAMAARLRAARR